ncbi:MAG: PQQ-binding-like beta-propeller repeat protein [Vicinamibacterales bacterium]
MTRGFSSLGGVVALVLLASSASAQTLSAADTSPYQSRCASCHGSTMTGGSGPDILTYIRYHTDAEAAAAIRERHRNVPAVPVQDAELRQILAGVRLLAGTNLSMATGGFTGRRGGTGVAGAADGRGGGGGGAGAAAAPEPAPARGAAPPASPSQGIEGLQPSTITMADGRTRTGLLLGQSELSAVLLENGRFTPLLKDGAAYRERAITPKADWTHYDGSLTGNRYSPLELINQSNVQRLGAAWVFPIASNPRAVQSTPVVLDGIMYFTGWNEIYALDATTGRQLWTYSEARHEGILSEGGIGTNRGVTISGDKAFMVTDHAHLIAFNRLTGQKLWDAEMGSYEESYSSTSPPLPVGDLLVVGVAGGEEGARGFLDAYRASTGERVWRWYSIPKRGEKGSETWIGQALEHGCGATWMPGSYDSQLDLIYWAIGNPCPDIAGEERIGDNLYTSSVVALNAKTGEMKWYYQFTPHDTHDWDAVQPMLLVDEMWQGKPRKLLMHGDRNGMFYVLDRTSGEVLRTANLSTKVTWHKGFMPNGKPIVDPGSIATKDGIAACPAGGGGANFQAQSYNPITKLFYARVSDSCSIYTSHDDPLGATGNRWFGRGTPTDKARAQLAELTKGYQTGVFIRAIDPFTGRKVWDLPAPAGRSGVLSTASELIFLGGGGGLLVVDAKTGKPLWNVNIAQTTQGSPMTYMVGGRQYIALPGTSSMTAYVLY